METIKKGTPSYKIPFLITCLAFLATLVFALSIQNTSKKSDSGSMVQIKAQSDSIMMLRNLLRANRYLLTGKTDSAMAIYEQYDSINWIKELSKSRIALVDSLKREKVIVKEIVEVTSAAETSNRSSISTEAMELIDDLSKEVELSKSQRDSMQQAASRETAELLRRMEEMEKSSDWKYLKFYKKTKSMYVNYVGQLKNGEANGKGVGIYSSGSVYRGEWRNGVRHGEGVFEWSDGEKYEGEYVNDQRHGYGVYHWSNGLRYEGQWRNDKREGLGTLFDKNNKVVAEGEWKNDKVLKK
jgi:hypothetical protein